MKKKIYLLLTLWVSLFLCSNAQVPYGTSTKPYLGQPGIKKSVSQLRVSSGANISIRKMDSNSVKPLFSVFKKYNYLSRPVRGNKEGILPPRINSERNSNVPAITSMPVSSEGGSTQQIWSNFLSIDFYENPLGWPPDPNGSVGMSQVIVATNNGLKVYDKRKVTDPPLVTPIGYSGMRADGTLFVSLEDFFSAVLPMGSNITDVHIRYDRLTQRWFVVAVEVNPAFENNLIFLAVSDGDKVTDVSSFTFYAFNSSLFPYNTGDPYAPYLDFPTLGIDKNSVVIGGNQFGYDSLTNVGYVIDKKKLLRGQLVVYPFELGVYNFIDGTVSGMFTPQGVHNDDPGVKKSFFAGITYFQDGLIVATLEYGRNGPWLSSENIIPVEPFNNPRDNSHPGSLTPLDQLDTRLLEATIHTNKITDEHSLWTAHCIGVNKQGHFINGTDSDFVREARSGARWYEVGNIYGRPGLSQSGTLNDNEEKSGRRAVQYFNPSIASSGQGHAVLAGTTDAFNEYLNVFVAGRYNSDQEGGLQDPVKATRTTAIYAPYLDFGGGLHGYIGRWGDFSQTVVDPTDDQTIWTFQEYANVDDSYGVRVVELKAPPPATPATLGTLSNKTDNFVVLNGVSTGNSGFFDPGDDEGGPGFNRLSVKSTGNVSVDHTRFFNPTKIGFRLNTKNKPAGNYFVVISNPDGQIAVAAYNIQDDNSNQNVSASKQDKDIIAAKDVITSDIYPNPTSGQFKLTVHAVRDFTGNVILLTTGGKIISEGTYTFTKGLAQIPLSIAGLSNGSYIAAVYNENKVLITVHKVVKQ